MSDGDAKVEADAEVEGAGTNDQIEATEADAGGSVDELAELAAGSDPGATRAKERTKPTPAEAAAMGRKGHKGDRDPRDGFNLEQRLALDALAKAFRGSFLVVTPTTGHLYSEGLGPLEIAIAQATILEWQARLADGAVKGIMARRRDMAARALSSGKIAVSGGKR